MYLYLIQNCISADERPCSPELPLGNFDGLHVDDEAPNFDDYYDEADHLEEEPNPVEQAVPERNVQFRPRVNLRRIPVSIQNALHLYSFQVD